MLPSFEHPSCLHFSKFNKIKSTTWIDQNHFLYLHVKNYRISTSFWWDSRAKKINTELIHSTVLLQILDAYQKKLGMPHKLVQRQHWWLYFIYLSFRSTSGSIIVEPKNEGICTLFWKIEYFFTFFYSRHSYYIHFKAFIKHSFIQYYDLFSFYWIWWIGLLYRNNSSLNMHNIQCVMLVLNFVQLRKHVLLQHTISSISKP